MGEKISMNATVKPRVLVVAPGKVGRGGIASVVHLHQRTRMWSAMRCRLLCTFREGSSMGKILAAGISYLRTPFALMGTQIVHIHAAGESSFLRKLPILFMAKALRKTVILHLHASSEASLFVRTPRWAWRYGLRSADCIITLSPTWENIIRKHVPDATIAVVPNPVRSFSTERRTRNLTPRVLYVGKVEQRKGYDTLLEAAAMLHEEHPNVEFWFAGHGELAEARAYSERLGISSAVRLLGWLSSEELEPIYEQVDIFCLPSRNEGVPMAMLEAMSHALPVVVTAVGGIPDVVRNGHNGLLVMPDNPHSIAEAISRLLLDPGRAECFAAAGQRTVQQSCDLEDVGDQLAQIYMRSFGRART